MVEPTVVVEALAALQTVQFSREMRFYNVIIGDTLQIVNAVRATNFGHIVAGIQECIIETSYAQD